MSTKIKDEEITIVIQGSTLAEYDGTRCIVLSVDSVRKVLPKSKIIVSTWENESVPSSVKSKVDKIIFNKDPGFETRNCKPTGKPNNVNRQIVSTINGVRQVETKYAMKLRSDFLLKEKGFLKYFDLFDSFDEQYRVFEKRVLCVMPGTRKPKAVYYNLPFHIADPSTFGLTIDLIKLYDIPLVTQEEFYWFINHTDFMPDTKARNKYNAEQSIWINCLRKNGIDVKCAYSTQINDDIIEQSDKCLVNNFYPISYKKFGLFPLKTQFLAKNCLAGYTDFYTQNEWKNLYKKYVDSSFKPQYIDDERLLVSCINKINEMRFIPKFIKNMSRIIVNSQL